MTDSANLLPTSFNENENIELKSGKTWLGNFRNDFYPEFYRTEDYSDEKVTAWNAKEVTDDKTLYIKWVTTADHVENAVSDAGKNNYTVYVAGTISETTISAIRSTIDSLYTENSEIRVSLNLDETTGLEKISEKAFAECIGLSSIIISESVTELGAGIFLKCTNLKSITLNCKADISSSAKLESGMFYQCTSLENITLNDNMRSIGDFAFGYCTGITTITIPDSVTSIGRYVFWWCKGITHITIPQSVTTLGDHVFLNCEKLTSVELPEGITSIGNGTFGSCKSLTSITIPEKVKTIGVNAFSNCKGLTRVTLPDSLKTIGNRAFQKCTGLTTIEIPKNVTNIAVDDSPFLGCTKLIVITVADENTTYSADSGILYSADKKTLLHCPKGKSGEISISNGTETIDSIAFLDCTKVTSIPIPESVTRIGINAFYSCNNLTTLTFKAPNNWYYLNYSDTAETNWIAKIGGTAITDTSKLTASNFISANSEFARRYLYKSE